MSEVGRGFLQPPPPPRAQNSPNPRLEALTAEEFAVQLRGYYWVEGNIKRGKTCFACFRLCHVRIIRHGNCGQLLPRDRGESYQDHLGPRRQRQSQVEQDVGR